MKPPQLPLDPSNKPWYWDESEVRTINEYCTVYGKFYARAALDEALSMCTDVLLNKGSVHDCCECIKTLRNTLENIK